LALLHSGYQEEACGWRDWLLRAIAGAPHQMQPVYGIAGEHRLPEWEIDWLTGFRDSRPVRAGNAAFKQLQIDVYGEVLDVLHQSRQHGIPAEESSWCLQEYLANQVERIWQQPDEGIWEARHGREHFTHSRVMAWVGLDRAIRAAENYRLDWPVEHWQTVKQDIHREVCEKGYDGALRGFVRSYESREPDASTLMIPIVGFLPPNDPRVISTVELIERTLIKDGFLMRYDTGASPDGMPEGEGAFLACTFWYIDNLILQGRRDEARHVFERVLDIRNDVGLLSEEYDVVSGELIGNFPQILSHVCLINSAHNLGTGRGPAHVRSQRSSGDAIA
jgi:GH15 family glucan-1,4-alpha-glucosidase